MFPMLRADDFSSECPYLQKEYKAYRLHYLIGFTFTLFATPILNGVILFNKSLRSQVTQFKMSFS